MKPGRVRRSTGSSSLRLEAKGLKPVGDADRYTLLRRVCFDLIGLPPTPEEVDAFVKDESPTAFETVVDRLLAMPQFGERWGRHWLDVARFAESSGKQVNFNYPHAWRYRDYVIAAFNTDKPFDRFIKEQIAGDLLPAADPVQRAEQTIATGFLAIGPKSHVEPNPFAVPAGPGGRADRRDLAGLPRPDRGLRRCHDHKFDPIPTRDYYAMAGIFRSTETCYGTTRIVQNNHPARLAPTGRFGSTLRHRAAERPAARCSCGARSLNWSKRTPSSRRKESFPAPVRYPARGSGCDVAGPARSVRGGWNAETPGHGRP